MKFKVAAIFLLVQITSQSVLNAQINKGYLGIGTVALNNVLLQTAGTGDTIKHAGYNYNTVSFYVVAHEDDWQLFMGFQAWYDVRSYHAEAPKPNGAKVVFIYTTDGAYCNDTVKTFNNNDPVFTDFCTGAKNKAYSRIREDGAMNSVYMAASTNRDNLPLFNYSGDETISINGHRLAVKRYRNTVSYFLRINTWWIDQWCGLYDSLRQNLAAPGFTTDGNVYENNEDLVKTLAAIYNYECNVVGDVVPGTLPWLNIQDPNRNEYNMCDHPEHTWAGTTAFMADTIFAAHLPGRPVLRVNLWEDYMIAAGSCSPPMYANLKSPDIQNKSALITAYEMSLLEDQSYVEWDTWPYFINRSYNRLSDTRTGW